MTLLTACARQTVVRTDFITPPESLLIGCYESTFEGETFGELVLYTSKLQNELHLCATRVDAIKKWSIEIKQRKEK